MSIHSESGSVRKYGMVSAFVLCLTLGAADQSFAASMGAYNDALASGNSKASAVEAMQLLEDQSLNGGASATEIMETAEQLMTGAVATGDEQVVKWVAVAILKGAGVKNFNAAELGARVVVDGTRYQAGVAQVVAETRNLMGLPLATDRSATADVVGQESSVITPSASTDRSFFAEMFDINRSSWSFSNKLTVGHDSNLYSNTSEEEGMVYKDAVSMSLSASSLRTAFQFFYKPTLTVSPEKDAGDVEVYQDFVGLLSHELSERNVLRLKETFRFQEDEDLYDTLGTVDNSFWKSTTVASMDRTMDASSRLSVSATGTVKSYSDSDQEGKDYTLFSVGSGYSRELSERTFATANLSYSVQDYDKATYDKGSSVVLVSAGGNHQLNSDLTIEGTAGAQFVNPDGSTYEDKVVPYFNGVVSYSFSPRTVLSGLLKYYYNEDSTSETSVGSESFRYQLGLRHSFTDKISLSSKIGRIKKDYLAEYSTGSTDSQTTYTDFSTSLAYQINRIHSVDAGYTFRDTDTDSADYDRNQFNIGWQVKF